MYVFLHIPYRDLKTDRDGCCVKNARPYSSYTDYRLRDGYEVQLAVL